MPEIKPEPNNWLTPHEPGPPDDPPAQERQAIGHAVGVDEQGRWIFAPGPPPADFMEKRRKANGRR